MHDPRRRCETATATHLCLDFRSVIFRFLGSIFASSGVHHHQHFRGKPASMDRQKSLSRDISHAADETYLVTRLTFTLLRYLGVGYRWYTILLALACYALLLMPGFLQEEKMERERDVEREKLRGKFSLENVWTAFVDNLSKRVSRRELRELFSSHGPVVRVFIPRETRNPKYKFSTFAVVHFGNEESLNRAIAKLNGSMIDGWRISVGTARYKDARVRSVRDERSYKDALLSDRLKSIASDHKELSNDGFNRRTRIKNIAKWGYVWNSCVVTFKSTEEMMDAWLMKKEELFFWFDRLVPLLNDDGVPMAFCLVHLFGVPLLCWQNSFFERLAGRWGTVEDIHEDTVNREDLSMVKILIRVASPYDVPEEITLGSYGRSFKVKIKLGSVIENSSAFSSKSSVGGSDERHFGEKIFGEIDGSSLSESMESAEYSVENNRHKVDTWFDQGAYTGLVGVGEEIQLLMLNKVGKSINCEMPACQDLGTNNFGEYAGLGCKFSNLSAYGSVAQSVENGQLGSPSIKIIPVGPVVKLDKFGKMDHKQFLVESAYTEEDKNGGLPHSCLTKLNGGMEPESELKLIDSNLYSGKRISRGKTFDRSNSALTTKSEPLEKRRTASYKRVYKRSRERRFWFDNDEIIIPREVESLERFNGKILYPNSALPVSAVAEANLAGCMESTLERQVVDNNLDHSCEGWYSEGDSHIFNSKSFNRRARRLLTRDALDQVSIETVSSSAFAVLLDEAIATWEISNILGVSFKDGKSTFFGENYKVGGRFEASLIFYVLGFSESPAVGSFGGLLSCWDESTFEVDNLIINRRFTWCNNQDFPTFVRLDRFLVDVHFLEAFPDVTQYLLPSSTLEVEDMKLNFSKILVEQSDILEKEFTEEEIWETLQSCDSNKAPGLDSFNMGFFKRFWSVLKVDILKFFHIFYLGKDWEHGVNHTFITLIPKVANIGGLDDYRPISLVGGLYKIFSKCLSRRLRNCISDLISPTQFAFIPGRQILDCSLIANEGVDFWRKKGFKGCVFKVDFRKAYDTVDWSILFKIMEKMGFVFKWRSWIKQCVTTASISVLINGVYSQEFPRARGLRQGCSLSPLLFNLVGELLNLLLLKAVSEGLFCGLQIRRNGSVFNLSHLQFADDLIIFCGASKMEISNVKRVLRVFEVMSGLQLNLKKSKLFGVNTVTYEVEEWATAIGCAVGKFPSDYLGLPLGATRNSTSLWDPIVLNFNNKLAGWKADTLSLAGRWNGENKIHWVSWHNVCKSKEAGGLGVLNISNMNRALLGKWSWRFANDKDAVWRRLICSKYNIDPFSLLFNSKIPAQASWIWSSVVNAYFKEDSFGSNFRSMCRVQVGNGQFIRFWQDKWVMDCPLKVSFPRLFAISSNQSGKLIEFGEFSSLGWIWNIQLRRSLVDWEFEQWANLMSIISNFFLFKEAIDGLIWKGNGTSVYSVNSCMKTCSLAQKEDSFWKNIVWKGLVPPRVELFMWQVVLQKLPVRSELAKRGVTGIVELSCPLCNLVDESSAHLFFSCSVVWSLWNKFVQYWSLNVVLQEENVQKFLQAWEDLNPRSAIWKFIPAVVIWTVWKARNDIVFDRGKIDQPNLFFLARVRLASWFLVKFADSVISMDSLIEHIVAGILRDEEGLLVGSFKEATGSGPPILMELKAIQKGLLFFNSVRGDVNGRDIAVNLKDVEGVIIWVVRTANIEADGYKAWGSLLGLQLAERDIIVACIDYRMVFQSGNLVREPSGGVPARVVNLRRRIDELLELKVGDNLFNVLVHEVDPSFKPNSWVPEDCDISLELVPPIGS
ncbi:hypothetical protein F3Y22_tig00112738pilonHSYRG00325 [Hibiscus syriacus]|uniref:RRM domain-containing protein n=1 Tax=Hibiscus syriacus TaxID=106335 RepID=A0A6A2Y3Q0_HIBSY|nr:hypothetical protein F3Y22_tig00112738pilonHSYRG00325 [Hibiscus syriacus]